jgi:predicted HicB family RNase H-like nuclease
MLRMCSEGSENNLIAENPCGTMEKKSVDYYTNLPYNFLIRSLSDESGNYYYGQVLELDGCQSHGDSFEEAGRNLREAMKGWLSVKLEHGDHIPEPVNDDNYSGKFIVRVPKSLHRRLAIEAQKEGISLNQYLVYKLSR